MEWFEGFFDELAMAYWDAVTASQTEDDLAFVARALPGPARRDILDVPCGSGRHAVALARAGHRVTAVDLEPRNVNAVREAAADGELPLVAHCADMRDLPWRSAFDGVLHLGSSFGYFDRDGVRRLFDSVARALRPAGAFVLDTGSVAEVLLPALRPRIEQFVAGIEVTIDNDYDPGTSRLTSRYVFLRDGARHERTATQFVFTTGEVVDLLERAGLHTLEMAGGDGGPFSLGARRLLLIARRGRDPVAPTLAEPAPPSP